MEAWKQLCRDKLPPDWFLAGRAIETSENILTARKMMIMILGDF